MLTLAGNLLADFCYGLADPLSQRKGQRLMLPLAVKRLLGRNLMLALGLVIVLGMSLAALLAPLLAPFDPNALHCKIF